MQSGGVAGLIGLMVTLGLIVFFVYTYFPSPQGADGETHTFKLVEDAEGVKATLEAHDERIQEELSKDY